MVKKDDLKETKMKKIIVLVIAMIFLLCPNTVYADTLVYDVYVNHVKQPFNGVMDEELLLPLKETYDLLGAKHSYDGKFNANVYQFNMRVVEEFIDDSIVCENGNYLGDVIEIDGIKYGGEDLFDITGVTMIVEEENQRVLFLTQGYLESILIKETDELRKTAPDLVSAINSQITSNRELNFNVNTTLTSVYTDRPVSAENPYKRTFVNVDGIGHGDLKNKICEFVFNVKLQNGNLIRQVRGFELRILDEVLYVMNPSNGEWLREGIDALGQVSSLSISKENTLFIATLRENLSKNIMENGKVSYSVKLDQEALDAYSKESAYGNIISAIKAELEASNHNYELQSLDIRFVLDGELIDVIHLETLVKETKSNQEIDMNIAVDIEFSNQSVTKEIVVPIVK